jgi:capsular exopolysaccharide synthesis family protein
MSRTQIQFEENHLADYLGVIRKRWRTVLATFLGFVAVAAILSFRLPPVYQATARVVIGSGVTNGLVSEGVAPVESYFLERRSFETQLEVIQSEPVAILAAQLLGWADENTAPERKAQLVSQIKARISVQHLRDTRIVLLRAVDSSPERAREVANAVAAAYMEYARAEGDEARNRSMTWLTSEIASLRERLRNSEERLVDYLATEQIDLAGATSTTPRDSTATDNVLQANLAAAEMELSELLGRYRGRHPKVLEARTRVASLRRRLADAQGSRAEDHRKLIQYRLLKRDADLDREMYEVLLKKLKEADVREGLSDVNISILERAKLPSVPIAPRTVRNLAIAALLGLCLAIALAFAVEYFDRSVGTADEVTRALGLPTLGVVNSFSRRAASVGLPAEVSGSREMEMFRTLRTNLRFSHVDMPRRVVLVTSTGPEEGKSTVVANLGVSLAQSGRRTLLIDTDLRRPALHGLLDLPRGRGLADALAGDAELADAIRPTRVDRLDVLVCGTLPANPAELIESARLQEMIAGLRNGYDYVLLDSPPAGGLVDASLLSSIADGVLFVVEPRRFDWRVLRGALRQLDRAGARIYGVVINKALEETGNPLGYYYYYDERLGRVGGGDADISPVGAA